MKTRMLGLLTIAAFAMSACSQSRMGLGGYYEDAYMLGKVPLCENVSGTLHGCFSITVNYNDNTAYIDVSNMDAKYLNTYLRIGVRASGMANYEQLSIVEGDDVKNNSFAPVVGSYVLVTTNSGHKITDFNEWFIESTTVANTGAGLVPVAVPFKKGTLMAHSVSIDYADLGAVDQAQNGNSY